MVSMKDISSYCHVSIATVSKALNNRGDISDETKMRVRQAAKEMGYLPNSSARALKTKRTYNIGVLFIDEANCGLTHSYFSHVLESFRRGVENAGYDITFISKNAGGNHLSYYEHSRYRGVDGVVVACVNFEDESVQELVNSNIPIVTIDYSFENHPSVLSDNRDGMRKIVEYVVGKGHRDIAYIHGEPSMVTELRLQSFRRTMSRLGVPVREDLIREGIYLNPIVSATVTDELLTLKDRPTCIIYPDDFSCFGGLNRIEANGLSIPDDISVVGYDGQQISRILEPKITTYKQNTEELGRLAAQKLVHSIENGKNEGTEHLVVRGQLVHGDSVKQL